MMEQLDLFTFPTYKITKPIRLIELFAGVGSQAMALRNIGANFTHHRVVEFDKYAIASYNAIHGTDFQTMDITKINSDDLGITERNNFEYILTYSFPCVDLSLAGKGLARKDGLKKGSSTRSGLLWEVERLLNELGNELPQILLMENVPQVATTDGFNDWCDFLKKKGYINHWQILNAKNYGVAQNRERCFMVSILSNDYLDYEFPKQQKLTKTVRDYLEPVVDEKYYINNEKAENLILDLKNKGTLPDLNNILAKLDKPSINGKFKSNKDIGICDINTSIASTITSHYYKGVSNHKDNIIINRTERKFID